MSVERSAARRPRFNGFNTMQGGHFRLITLGRLALERSDGHVDERLASLNSRRRKVALLAVLSLARRGVSRDALVEMFWGDQDETRARHSLSDAISHLRRVLGRESIVATRSDIAIAPAAPLVVDAVELASSAVGAREVGERADALVAATERTVALYTGPFLGGVYLEGSATFEHWVSCERARLERLFVRAAEVRCKALAIAGQWGECQTLAERWLDADPLSAEAAVTYLKSLSDAGEGDGRVLAAFERLRARLDREYEMEPDPEVAAVAARIAERRRERVAAAVRAEIARGAAGGPPPTTESAANPPAIHHPSNPPSINPPLSVRAPRTRPHIALGLITFILVAAAFVAGANRSAATTPRTSATTVLAIAAIEPTGSDTSLAWLADGLPQMLAAKLARNADVEVVPPAQIRAVRLRAGATRRALSPTELLNLGHRVGATVVVSGAITRAGTNAMLELDLRALPDGRVRRISVTVERDILALVDRATVQLLGAIGSTRSGATLADLETPSIAAYQHFTRYAHIAAEGRGIGTSTHVCSTGFWRSIR